MGRALRQKESHPLHLCHQYREKRRGCRDPIDLTKRAVQYGKIKHSPPFGGFREQTGKENNGDNENEIPRPCYFSLAGGLLMLPPYEFIPGAGKYANGVLLRAKKP
jgi:hypothetical protein